MVITMDDMAQAIEKELGESPPICTNTREVLVNLYLGLDVSTAQQVDFGIDSEEHYLALQNALFAAADEQGVRAFAEELDAALGNGPKLTALVKKYASGYEVTFKTGWDIKLPRPE